MTEISKVKMHQVCVVVKDLEKSVENYWKLLGIGPWSIYTLKPPQLENATYHGRPTHQEFKVALAMLENIELELIQPVKGENIYADFLKTKGEGLHHINFERVEDVNGTLAKYERIGAKVTQTAKFGEDEWGYVDTESLLGTILEIDSPSTAKLPPPDKSYPPNVTV